MRWPRSLSLARDESALEAAMSGSTEGSGVDGGRAMPAALAQLGRVVTLSTGRASAWELHQRLRPVMREIARHRLQVHHGLDLDAENQAGPVRDRLGADLYDLLRADRPAPSDRGATGIALSELGRHIDHLETL